MTNFFKKTLVAAAVLSFVGAANAATVNVNGANLAATADASLEAAVNKAVLKVDTALTGLKTATGDVGIEIAPNTAALLLAGDVISVKVTGGSIVRPSGAGNPTLLFAVAADTAGTGVAAFDAAKSTATEALFTVTTGTAVTDVSAAIGNMYVNVSSAAPGSKLTVTYTVTRPGQAAAVDTYPVGTANPVSVFEFKSQYVLTRPIATKLDGTISTGDKRLSFTGTTPTNDELAYTVTDNETYAFAGSLTQTKTVITGDFAYLAVADNKTFNPAANGDGKLSSAEISTLVGFNNPTGGTFGFEVSSDYKTLTLTESANNQDGARTLTFNTPKSVAGTDAAKLALATQLAPASFAATISGVTNPLIPALSYTAKAADAESVGAWELDGSSTFVNYMPFGDNVSQIIYATNDGSVDGNITLAAYDETGKKYGPYALGVVKAKTVLQLAGLIKTKLTADGFKAGKVALTVDTDAPSVVVYSAYNVGGNDRGLVVNK